MSAAEDGLDGEKRAVGRSAVLLREQHLGDVISGRAGARAASTAYARILRNASPTARLLATANGNLQRIVSSWLNVEVVVSVKDSNPTRRIVELSLPPADGGVFCVAKSVVSVYNSELSEQVYSGKLGIAQLFRKFNLKPTFVLFRADLNEDSLSYREYVLECQGQISCEISERFLFDPLLLRECRKDKNSSNANVVASSSEAHLGDVVGGLRTALVSPNYDEFSNLQRALLQANGNVVRILECFYPDVSVTKISDFPLRVVHIESKNSVVLCEAKSTCAGDFAQTSRVLPTFELLKFFKKSDFEFSRIYELSFGECVVRVEENFTLVDDAAAARLT